MIEVLSVKPRPEAVIVTFREGDLTYVCVFDYEDNMTKPADSLAFFDRVAEFEEVYRDHVEQTKPEFQKAVLDVLTEMSQEMGLYEELDEGEGEK